MKALKTISTFLGISMFMFGILKFVNPFKGWYSIQISNSGLGAFAYWLGISGELFVGILFIIGLIIRKMITPQTFNLAIVIASVTVIIMMSTGIIVHLNPNVPAEVLPLKIKPPFLPILFLLLAVANLIWVRKASQKQSH